MPTIESICDALHAVLRNWKHSNIALGGLAELSLFTQHVKLEGAPKQTIQQLLSPIIKNLSEVDIQSANILKLRFLDSKIPRDAAEQLHISEAHLYRKQRQAIRLLAGSILAQENQVIGEQQFIFEQRLVAPVHRTLFGIDEHLSSLKRLITRSEEPWIIAIEGIGGIGKTALTDALLRQLIASHKWHGMAWVSAATLQLDLHGSVRPVSVAAQTIETIIAQLYEQLLPDVPHPALFAVAKALTPLIKYLRQSACLIVIDNLETVEEVDRLLPILRQMMNPTKFVLTSRKNFYAESEVAHFPVPELSPENSLRLIRREAAIRQSMHLQTATDNELRPIYQLVGGNPLALHLVAGQLHNHAIATVLEDLKQARGQNIEALYQYIYFNSWKLLDTNARRVFTFMPLATDLGGTLKQIETVTELPAKIVRTSLERLILFNLVQAIPQQERYTIHSLTRTFLLEQVIQWQ